MGANAVKSHGTIVARQAGGTGSFVDIGELGDITPPPLTRAAIEALSQTDNDDYYVYGMRRAGPFSFNINFNPTLAAHDHVAGLIYSWQEGLIDGWRFTYPDADASTVTCSGAITNMTFSAPIDGILSATVTVQPTGIKAFDN